MILVTGAAGKTGRAVIRALTERGEDVRALVHRPEQVRPIQELGAQQVVAGDMLDPTTMNQVARDMRAVYHICPNVSPDEVVIGEHVIAAARAAEVEHFVFHSVLHPQVKAMPHHWQKMLVEEQLFQSKLRFTILQPAAYMQNVLAQWGSIVKEGVYSIPYPVETQLSLVDLNDAAEAAAVVLGEPGHEGATYELVGIEPLSQNELAATLSQQLGRPVRVQVIPLDHWERQAQASGLGAYQIQTLIKMFQYYALHGLGGNPWVLSCLLGHPPTTFADFVEKVACTRN